MRKSELEISVLAHRVAKGAEYLVEVVVSSTGLAIGDHGSTDDLNGTITSTVSTGHIGVEVVDGTNEGGVTELLVHVVSTRTGIVSQPNTIGLDGGISLVDLVGKDEKREHGWGRPEREGGTEKSATTRNGKNVRNRSEQNADGQGAPSRSSLSSQELSESLERKNTSLTARI